MYSNRIVTVVLFYVVFVHLPRAAEFRRHFFNATSPFVDYDARIECLAHFGMNRGRNIS